MTRGDQRDRDRARAQARAAKGPQAGKDGGNRLNQMLDQAEIMREKQKKAELKKQGIVEEDKKPQKVIDDSYLKQFENLLGDEGEEEEKQPEEEQKVEEQIQPKAKKAKGK